MPRPTAVRPLVLILAAVVMVVTIVLAVLLAGDEEGASRAAAPTASTQFAVPPPDAVLPVTPQLVADELTGTTRALRRAIDVWTAEGDPLRERPPEDLVLLAMHQQRLAFAMAGAHRLGDATLALLPADVRAEAADTVAARRALAAIPKGDPDEAEQPAVRTGPPEPPGLLRRHYGRAQERFGVRWELLAAVNFVESGFGRLRNSSVAGARGPMQFMPPTWEAYGLGGDIDDPRDAILGAANYLSASGAPEDQERALFAYNRSTSYVEAVSRHAAAIARDPRHFYALYAWQVYVESAGGAKRITGPGL
ncbi:MAG TPA: lytic murein transglycosylase [Solirubrobacteraceae bacterium]|nr:lytic murein transglycosylase [Solirubrobacteraceae bacterium]